MTSKVRPLAASHHLPSMYIFLSVAVAVVIMVSFKGLDRFQRAEAGMFTLIVAVAPRAATSRRLSLKRKRSDAANFAYASGSDCVLRAANQAGKDLSNSSTNLL